MRLPSPSPITMPFGSQDPPYSKTSPHMGTDFAHSPDDIIYAPFAGTVVQVPLNGADGNGTYMYDSEGRFHGLLHASKYLVPNRSRVNEGDRIAVMGETGRAEGVHLHWCVKVNGQFIDPMSLIQGGKGAGEMADIVENTDAQYQRYGRLHRQVVGYWPERQHFVDFAANQETTHVVDIISNAPAADRRTYYGDIGQIAVEQDWQGKIATLTEKADALAKNPTKAQFDDLNQYLIKCNADFKVSQDQLAAVQKQQADDQAAGESFSRRVGQWLSKFAPEFLKK